MTSNETDAERVTVAADATRPTPAGATGLAGRLREALRGWPNPTRARGEGDAPEADLHLAWPVAALLIALAIRIVPTLDAVRPIVFEDEIGYLANARLLAGLGASSLGEMGSYQAGWSLLLVPVFWLAQDPDVIYRFAVTIAMVAGWATAFPVAGVLRRAMHLPRRMSLTVAAVGCLVPGPVLMGGYVYAEGILSLTFALLVLLAFRFSEEASLGRSLALGACAGYLSGLHGRMIALPILVVLFFAIAAATRKVRPHVAAGGVLAVVAVALVGRSLDEYVIEQMYTLPFDRLSSGFAAISALTPRSYAVLGGGQAWYLLATTAGLLFVGAAALTVVAVREIRDRRFGPALLWALSAAAVFGVSSVSSAASYPNFVRLDYISYGRYVDVLTPGLVSLALAVLVVRRRGNRVVMASSVLVTGLLGVAFYFVAGGGPAFVGKPIAALSVPGLAWAIDPALMRHPVVLATIVAVAAGSLLVALTRRPAVVVAVWLVLASAASVAGEFRTMRVLDAPWSQLLTLQEIVQDLDPEQISYDLTGYTLYGRNGYQFHLPEAEFVFFNGDAELPTTELVIGRQEWDAGEAAGARLVAQEDRLSEALWVMPGALQKALEAQGRLVPTE